MYYNAVTSQVQSGTCRSGGGALRFWVVGVVVGHLWVVVTGKEDGWLSPWPTLAARGWAWEEGGWLCHTTWLREDGAPGLELVVEERIVGLSLRQRGCWMVMALLMAARGAWGQQAAVVFHEGAEALQRGELREAEADFRKVIAMDPQSSAAHVNLGVTLMREKQWAAALEALQKADALRPGQAGVQLNIGLVHYRQNQFAAAIPAFRAAVEEGATGQQAEYLLGLCYFFTAQYKAAVTSLAALWEAQENNLNYLYVVSISASKSGDADLQKRAFDRMLAIGQDKPEFHLYVGKAWLAEDSFANALKEFGAAEAADPKMPMVHHFLGRTYLQQHEYLLAEAEFLRDIALEPEVASNYEDLGMLYASTGRAEKAKEQFRLALERDGTLVSSLLGLAKLERQDGRDREALALMDRAVVLAPRNASVHYLRGQELAKTGDATKAKTEFAASAELLKAVNDQLQQGASGDQAVDAQAAAQQ